MTEREALKLALEALEYEPIGKTSGKKDLKDQAIAAIKEALAQPEPVAWPCVIAEADFSENTVTLAMQCTDYKVSAGKHWLSTNPPQRTWVGLTPQERDEINEQVYGAVPHHVAFHHALEAKLKEKNT